MKPSLSQKWVASRKVGAAVMVITNCKNNDGEFAPRSAWERRNGLFAPEENFDLEAFDGVGRRRRFGQGAIQSMAREASCGR
jgi:hypothetical protein